jgi:hypothetical protein
LEKELRGLYFVIFATLLLAILLATLLYYHFRARRSAEAIWEEMLERLTWIDRAAISAIALDVVSESGEPRPKGDGFVLDRTAIWRLLGGLKGLEVVEHNCKILVELASYLQRWYPEALVVAEQLRLNAREIEWHVGRLKGAAQTGNLESAFADYAQRAVATYYVMTRQLLALYDQASFPRLAELKRAI